MVWKVLTEEAIGYENGVLGCVSAAVQAFTSVSEAVFAALPPPISDLPVR